MATAAPYSVLLILASTFASALGAECDFLAEMTNLPPGFWKPAFIYRSMQLRLDHIGAVPSNMKVTETGLCGQGFGLKAQDFSWQSPTNVGGDFVATTESPDIFMTLQFGDEITKLNALALTTLDPLSLRLQFEGAAGKAAIEVPLRSQAQGGMKIMNWLCTVTVGSQLCAQAKAKLGNRSSAVPLEPVYGQGVLDISAVATAASQGVTHLVAKSDCFENLHWLSLPAGLGIDAGEWELLTTVLGLLSPPVLNSRPIAVDAQVQSLCFLSCDGSWNEEQCGPLSEKITTTTKYVAPVEVDKPTGLLSDVRLRKFKDAFSDSDTAPWLFLCIFLAFFIGAMTAWWFVRFIMPEPTARFVPRKVKQVEVNYPDATRTMLR